MNKAELLVNGKSLIFTDKSIIFDGHELFYENISNIAHRGGDHPAMIFNYNGKRLALPYHPKDRNIVIKMFRDIIEEKKTPASPSPAPVADYIPSTTAPEAQPSSVNVYVSQTNQTDVAYNNPYDRQDSYFDGTLLQNIGWNLLGGFLTLITLGICFPWAICMICKWEANHTVINGRRLTFDGTAMQLFGNWIKWLLLTIITLGIYGFWLAIAVKKWKTKHTRFAD